MVDDIAYALEALAADSNRCPDQPATAIRRRGDHRRSAVRVAATGGTIALVGATAGTAFAVAQQTPGNHGGRVGIATQTSSHPHSSSDRARRLAAKRAAAKAADATSTPTPTATASTPVGSPTPTATPSEGPGTATPIATPSEGPGTATPTPTPTDGSIVSSSPSPTAPIPSASPTSS